MSGWWTSDNQLFHLTTVSFDFKLLLNVLCSILPFLFWPPSLPPIPNRGSVKSSAVGAVTGLCLDLSREWIWICWEWIDIWTRSFQFQAWLHLELLSCRGQWETPQSAQFGVAAIVFYGVSICQLALPFQSLKIFLNYGRSQYVVRDLDSKGEHGALPNCSLTVALSWFFLPSQCFVLDNMQWQQIFELGLLLEIYLIVKCTSETAVGLC